MTLNCIIYFYTIDLAIQRLAHIVDTNTNTNTIAISISIYIHNLIFVSEYIICNRCREGYFQIKVALQKPQRFNRNADYCCCCRLYKFREYSTK